MSIAVMVSKLPPCDFCKEKGLDTLAHYDAKTIFGPWANLCLPHFIDLGYGLGTGLGQKLILPKEKED